MEARMSTFSVQVNASISGDRKFIMRRHLVYDVMHGIHRLTPPFMEVSACCHVDVPSIVKKYDFWPAGFVVFLLLHH